MDINLKGVFFTVQKYVSVLELVLAIQVLDKPLLMSWLTGI